ncbi:MAG: HK97 family phage prohead protease [Spirochaetaceae bacterium]|nr:HK97 family phage prohead protease [Spirochaetaceae bacterium]
MNGTEGTERRFAAIEFRAEGDRLSGVVVPYGVPSNLGRFTETIAPGAFAPIGELRLNVMHVRERSIAVNREGGGLVLDDTPTDLRAQVVLPKYGEGPAVSELVSRRVLTGFSVEMTVSEDTWEGRRRMVKRARLVGLGLVDVPGHEGAILELEKRYTSAGMTPRRARFWL